MGKPDSLLYGLPIKLIAELCHVSLKTAARWKNGQTVPGYCALAVLARDLGCFDSQWRGWSVRGGELHSPEGWAITVGDVLASPLLRSQLAVYQAENRALRALADQMQDQPLPCAPPSILSG